MKRLLLISLMSISSYGYAQVRLTPDSLHIDGFQGKPIPQERVILYMLTQQGRIAKDVDTIKLVLKNIDEQTTPASPVGTFMQGKFMDKAYDTFFGEKSNERAIPVSASVIGALGGITQLTVSTRGLIRGSISKGDFVVKILVALVIFFVSFLLITITVRPNVTYNVASQHSDLKQTVDLIYKEILKKNSTSSKLSVIDTNYQFPDVSPNFNKISSQLESIQNSIALAEKNTANKIEEESTKSWWIFLNGLFLVIICIITGLTLYAISERN